MRDFRHFAADTAKKYNTIFYSKNSKIKICCIILFDTINGQQCPYCFIQLLCWIEKTIDKKMLFLFKKYSIIFSKKIK